MSKQPQVKVKRMPTFWEAFIPVLLTIAILAVSILKFELDVHIPLIIGAMIASFVAITRLGFTWQEIEAGMMDNIRDTLQAILILAVVGGLIGSWIQGGIVPTLIYYGLQILSPGIFLAASMLLASVVALATGSSWTTAGTIGIALMGVGAGLGIPAPVCAGAVISGAYFGDKMSPLSDTTNLAPAMAGSNLFDHIKHMVYTTGVTYVIVFVIFAVMGMKYAGQELNVAEIQGLLETLKANFTISPVLMLAPLAVIGMVVFKIPAIPGLVAGVFFGALASAFQGNGYGVILDAIQNGFVSETGNSLIDDLLTRGGIQSMMWTISLIMCALTFGGTLDRSGMLEVLAQKILTFAKSTGALVTVTVFSCIFVNILSGDQYLSLVLPGKMFKDEYHKRGLAPRNLSRVLEDSGTITSALVPWNTCGATMSNFLGIPTLEYLPYCFFNLLNPVVSIIFGFTGFTMMKLEDDPSAPEYTGVVKAKA